MTQYLKIEEAQQEFIDLPQKLTTEPIIITQDGLPVMTAMSYEQFESLIETLEIVTDDLFSEKLKASIAQAETKNTISWEEAKIKLGI